MSVCSQLNIETVFCSRLFTVNFFNSQKITGLRTKRKTLSQTIIQRGNNSGTAFLKVCTKIQTQISASAEGIILSVCKSEHCKCCNC